MNINQLLWVIGNFGGLFTFITAVLFATAYAVIFNPWLTDAGSRVWWAFVAIAAYGANTVLGVFIDGRTSPFVMPADVAPWRPLARLILLIFILIAFARLVQFVIVRRFWPDQVKIAPDEHTLELRRRSKR